MGKPKSAQAGKFNDAAHALTHLVAALIYIQKYYLAVHYNTTNNILASTIH